jgi:integrase/recombinase XerD
MTHLRKMMLEELERRNWAQTILDRYLRAMAEFSLLFHRPPNQLGPEHIRQCQARPAKVGTHFKVHGIYSLRPR